VNPNPPALRAAVGDALSDRPGLLILDSYELLAPLDDWLREEFFVQLPAHVLV
jgi:ABC-type molybdate transport system ATPase subunit